MRVLQDRETVKFSVPQVHGEAGQVLPLPDTAHWISWSWPGIVSAEAHLPQEHFSCSRKTGQAITGKSCSQVEDASGSSEPYGTLRLCSCSCKAVAASLPMSDWWNRLSPRGCGCFLLLLPLWFWLDHLQHTSFWQGTQLCLPICLEREF